MKIILYISLFLLSIQLQAQSYQKEWEKIYDLEKKGSYQTMFEEINALHKKASKKNNEVEKAKAFLFQMKLENVLNETYYQIKIERLQKKSSKKNNEVEKAKAFLFQMKLENVLNETSYQMKIERLQKEISSSKGVIQSVYRWYYVKTLLAAYDSKQSYWRRNQLVET